MDSAALFQRYQDLQRYVGWQPEDAARLAALRPLLAPHIPPLIDDFYEEISRHELARKVITGGDAQVQRLKGTLHVWVSELFSGQYDESYVMRRWRVGWRHVDIRLDQVYTNAALSRLRGGMVEIIERRWTGEVCALQLALRALHRLLDLDLAIIEDAYQAEYNRRQEQAQRLAAIGQMAMGVAHELRQPLNVIRTSVYYLLNAQQPRPERVRQHLQRIDDQVVVADGVITTMSSFARMPVPDVRPVDVARCIAEALTLAAIDQDIGVTMEIDDRTPTVLADADQLRIVFRNLISNARDAMPDGGELRFWAERIGDVLEIHVSDSGSGIRQEDIDRVLEPLFTTKPRGMGLGLSIVRAILDKLGGQIRVQSELGKGSVFTVRLPAAQQ
jgi:signal transduction histidine kinase